MPKSCDDVRQSVSNLRNAVADARDGTTYVLPNERMQLQMLSFRLQADENALSTNPARCLTATDDAREDAARHCDGAAARLNNAQFSDERALALDECWGAAQAVSLLI
jgi:hypothetical protein